MPGVDQPTFVRQPGGPPGTSVDYKLEPVAKHFPDGIKDPELAKKLVEAHHPGLLFVLNCTACKGIFPWVAFPSDRVTGTKHRCHDCSRTLSQISKLADSLIIPGHGFLTEDKRPLRLAIAALKLGLFHHPVFQAREDFDKIRWALRQTNGWIIVGLLKVEPPTSTTVRTPAKQLPPYMSSIPMFDGSSELPPPTAMNPQRYVYDDVSYPLD